jgi:hypothetical protein
MIAKWKPIVGYLFSLFYCVEVGVGYIHGWLAGVVFALIASWWFAMWGLERWDHNDLAESYRTAEAEWRADMDRGDQDVA